jgi:hypothetical protein
MLIVLGFLAFGVVLAIAAALVVREASRMSSDPPAAIFDPDEAYEWVVRHVPDDVAATLTPDDVRRILDFQLEYFQRKGVSGNGSSSHPPGPVVVGGSETVDYILERSAATGEEYLPEQVRDTAHVPAGHRGGRARGAAGRSAPCAAGAHVTHGVHGNRSRALLRTCYQWVTREGRWSIHA